MTFSQDIDKLNQIIFSESGTIMNFVKDDFAYYRRSFEQMYRSYFQRRMIVVGIALLIICAYLALDPRGISTKFVFDCCFARVVCLALSTLARSRSNNC